MIQQSMPERHITTYSKSMNRDSVDSYLCYEKVMVLLNEVEQTSDKGGCQHMTS